MIKIIAGLGNPGKEYLETRHNLGFRVVDLLYGKLNASKCSSKFHAEICEAQTSTGKIFLFKAATYMNESGQPLGEFARFYKINTEETLVIHDEIDLPVGHLRLSLGGSAGGHNGVKSVIEHIGESFLRLRIGIGDNRSTGINAEDYVLQTFKPEEREVVEKVIQISIEIVEMILQGDLEKVKMEISNFNQNL